MKAELLLIPYPGDDVEFVSQFFTQELSPYGIELSNVKDLSGMEDELKEFVAESLKLNDVLIFVGDHHIGDVISDVTGSLSITYQSHLARLREYHQNAGLPLPDDFAVHANFPQNSKLITNNHGPMAGFICKKNGKFILSLPGKSREFMPMINEILKNFNHQSSNDYVAAHSITAFGMSEKVLAARLSDLLASANPQLNLYSKIGETLLQVVSHSDSQEHAEELIKPFVQAIKDRLGVNFVGVDVESMQNHVVDKLISMRLRLAVSEDTKESRLTQRLSEIPNAASALECSVNANPKNVKEHALYIPPEDLNGKPHVSAEIARQMAINIRKVGNSDIGFSITDSVQTMDDEGSFFLTYVSLADHKRVWVKEIRTPLEEGNVEQGEVFARFHSVSFSLDLLRKYLDSLPTVMAGGEMIDSYPEPLIVKDLSEKRSSNRGFLSNIFPVKSDTLSDKLKKSTVLAVIVIIIGVLAFVFATKVIKSKHNQNLYGELQGLYTSVGVNVRDLPRGPNGFPILAEFATLYERNDEVRGWVSIKDTNVNYPAMQDNGTGFYKTHNFDKNKSSYGVPYYVHNGGGLDAVDSATSLAIYGNNSRDGQMFSDVAKYYDNIDYLREHSLIEMNTIYEKAQWKVFAVMVIPKPNNQDVAFDYTKTTFASEEEKQQYIKNIKTFSIYDVPTSDIAVDSGDFLLFIATDFQKEIGKSDAHIVVAARKVRANESLAHPLSTSSVSTAFQNDKAAFLDSIFKENEVAGDKENPSGSGSETSTPSGSVPSDTIGSSSGTGSTNPSDPSVTGDGTTDPSDPSQTPTASPGGSTSPTSPTSPSDPGSTNSSDKPSSTNPSYSNTTPTTPKPTSPTNPNKPIPTPNVPSNVPVTTYSSPEHTLTSKVKVTGFEGSFTNSRENWVEIVSRVVYQEVRHSKFHNEAVKAQAVASYTYILHSGSVNIANLVKVTDSARYNQIKALVDSVLGEKVMYQNSPANTLYFASAAGVTLNSQNIYGGSIPYILPVESKYDEYSSDLTNTYYSRTHTISQSQLLTLLSAHVNAPVYCDSVIRVTTRDPYGKYVLSTNAYYKLDGKTVYVTGRQLRECTFGTAWDVSFPSAAFTISGNAAELSITFEGYGHGGGMSQHGANGYAIKEGWNYKQILYHYYSFNALPYDMSIQSARKDSWEAY